jgi:hypothetical protein
VSRVDLRPIPPATIAPTPDGRGPSVAPTSLEKAGVSGGVSRPSEGGNHGIPNFRVPADHAPGDLSAWPGDAGPDRGEIPE